MSFADYSQSFDDHKSLLILVRPVGLIKVNAFNKVFDEINACSNVCLASESSRRHLRLRFKRTCPIENNSWGDFQAHRKVVGILCVATFETEDELEEAYKHYEILRDKYSSTLFDSRILLLWKRRLSRIDGETYYDHEDTKVSESIGPCLQISSGEAGETEIDSNSPSDLKYSFQTSIVETNERIDFLSISKSDVENETVLKDKAALPPCSPNRETALAIAESDQLNEATKKSVLGIVNDIDDPLRVSTLDIDTESSPRIDRKSTEVLIEKDVSEKPPFPARKGAWLVSSPSSRAEIEDRIREMADALFWALESRRLDLALDRQPALLMAPFEKKEFVGLDSDSRNHRRRCQGRHYKQVGDLCLQSGLTHEAIRNYQLSLDILRHINDFLWMGAAEEGVSVASAMLHYRPVAADDVVLVQSPKLADAYEAGTSVGQQTPMKAPSQLHKVLAHHRSGSYGSSVASSGSTNNSDSKELAGSNGSLTASTESDSATNLAVTGAAAKPLGPHELIESYKEAVIHYSKCRHAGIIEMEASIKATQILILQKRFLLAHDFLQNVIYINLQLSDEEKISRYTTLSDLYVSTGFHRKAAFFRRVAAMQCVAPTNPRPTWQQCFDLLLETMKGYKFSLNPQENNASVGWPILQKRLLHELIFTARKMGQLSVAARILTLYLECLHGNMTSEEISQMADLLQSYSQRNSAAAPQSLSLDSKGDYVAPPVSLTWMPEVIDVILVPANPDKLPVTHDSQSGKGFHPGISSPFIYSPLNLRSQQRPNDSSSRSKRRGGRVSGSAIVWAAGDESRVRVTLRNPVDFDLRVSRMRLSASGCGGFLAEMKEEWTVVPRSGGVVDVFLAAKPKIVGELVVDGIGFELLGVWNEVSILATAAASKLDLPLTATVVPRLPSLNLEIETRTEVSVGGVEATGNGFSQAQRSKASSLAIIDVLAGQSIHAVVKVCNTGSTTVDLLDVSFEQAGTVRSRQAESRLKSSFVCDAKVLRQRLPLAPGAEIKLPLTIRGAVDTETRIGTAEESSSASVPTITEALLTFVYSGGEGLAAGFCRHAAVAFRLNVRPSISAMRWTATPIKEADDTAEDAADGKELFQMALELRNVSDRAMSVWGTGKDKSDANKSEINPGENAHVTLRLPKVRFPDFHDISLDGITARQALEERRLQFAHFVADLVDVRWKIDDDDLKVEGFVAFDRLMWDQSSLCAMNKPHLRFDWTHPATPIRRGIVTTIQLSLVPHDVDDISSDTSVTVLKNVRLDFRIVEDSKESTSAIFVGTNVFKHSKICLDRNPIVTSVDLVPLGNSNDSIEVSCVCSATVKDAICDVAEEAEKTDGRCATWRIPSQILRVES